MSVQLEVDPVGRIEPFCVNCRHALWAQLPGEDIQFALKLLNVRFDVGQCTYIFSPYFTIHPNDGCNCFEPMEDLLK